MWKFISAEYPFHKLDGTFGFYLPCWLCLNPLCEFVDGHIQEPIATSSSRERLEDVKPPTREWLGEKDSLKCLSWHPRVFAVKLTSFTPLYQITSVLKSCWQNITLSKGFSDQSSPTGMRSIDSFMDVE